MTRRRYLAVLAPLALAGCAYTPDEVEQRRQAGYAMAQGAHDQILHDTDVNYAREMHQAQEWNVPSIFGLPASGALAVLIIALVVVLAIGVAWAAARYKLGAARAAEARTAANTREQQLTERKRIEKDVAAALQQAHECPCCSATPKEQLTAQRVLDAANDSTS